MIHLPPLQIERDELAEVRLLAQARTWLEQDDGVREPGIHASDLLDPRIGYWREADPQPISERQVWLYLIGKVLHGFVLSVAQPDHDPRKADTGTFQELGIWYSPDLLRLGYPVELKTSRAYEEPPADQLQAEWSHYFEQLATYLVLTNSRVGYLWVLLINLREPSGRRTFPEPRCYRVELTEDQFYALEEQITVVRDQLAVAKQAQDHRLLPLCRPWKCARACNWWTKCRPEGRWPDEDKRKWSA